MPPLSPTISVVLANWNGSRFLDDAVASVVHQTYAHWEMIGVDTGSQDQSCEILRQWAARDQRIKPIFCPWRLGCPSALNLAIAHARGEWIARIESDDVWQPHRLQTQLDFLAQPGQEHLGVCGSDALLMNASGRHLGLKIFPHHHADCLRAIWYRNPFCHSSVLIRRAALDQCGAYDEDYYLVEDLELRFRIARQWELGNLPEPLVNYRLWEGSLTTRRLRQLAWRAHRVRNRAVKQLGYRRPKLAWVYSWATVAASVLPPLLVRKIFERGLRAFQTSHPRANLTALTPGAKQIRADQPRKTEQALLPSELSRTILPP